MNLYFCYNTIVDFDSIKFRDFIRDKFAEWRGKGMGSLGEYAAYLGVSQQNMSNWYNGKFKRRPEGETLVLLIKKYGVEVYDVMALPRPSEEEILSKFRGELKESVELALAEVRSSGLKSASENASPEELKKVNDILLKHLGKYLTTL